VRDAVDLAAFLKYRAGYDQVEQLVSGVTDEQVVDTAVRLTRELEPGDLFVFYFSGHGIEYGGRHLLLCPKAQYNRLQFYRQTVPVDQLRDETGVPGVDRVFVLDACRTSPVAGRGAGGLHGEVILRDVVANAQAKNSDTGSFGMMSSCSEGEQAGELVSRQNGLFTGALLSVLGKKVAAGSETRLDDDLRVSVAKEMAALGTEEGVWHTQNPWTQCSGPGTPVLIPSGVRETNPTPTASPQAGPQRVRPILRGEPSRAGLVAQQELRCGNCGKRIVSELGIAGRCRECQVPLCAECFEIRGITRCAIHQQQAK
jgi:hypothetical protein